MADTARFWLNQPDSARIEANSARIEPHRRESEKKRKKKKNADAVQHAGNRVLRHAASDAGAAPLVPRPCFLDSHRDLELVIKSAQNLSNIHHLALVRGLKPYALVSIRNNNNNICSSPSLEERTSVQEGSNVIWSLWATLHIDLAKVEENGLALVVRLKSNRSSDKDIGLVHVPITELLGGFSGVERQMNKSVVNSDGMSQQEKEH